MPVTFVPLLSHVFLNASAPLNAQSLQTAVAELLPRTRGALPELPEGSLPGYISTAQAHMLRRGMIVRREDGLVSEKTEHALLQFYANSLGELISPTALAKDAARAKS
jgi:hypothetical protein